MAEKSFEDQFDHDPDAVYEEEEEADLGLDDEFAAPKKASKRSKMKPPPEKHSLPKIGCFSGVFKIFLSLGLIIFFAAYLLYPDVFAGIRKKVTNLSLPERHSNAPVSPLTTKPAAIPYSARERVETDYVIKKPSPKQELPKIFLPGGGFLQDFSTASEKKPSLNTYLSEAGRITYETLDTYRGLVKKLIEDWTGETDEERISQIVGLSYHQFFNQTSAFLLAQTLLKQTDQVSVGIDKIIVESPPHIMAAVYPPLKLAIASKTSLPAQLQTLEPISSFLIYVCKDEPECMASWDLLIEMLGFQRYAKRLEKAPETIYMRKQQ